MPLLPSKLPYVIFGIFAIIALMLTIWLPDYLYVWRYGFIAFLSVMGMDALWTLWKKPQLKIERILPNNLPIGLWTKITLKVSAKNTTLKNMRFFDAVPATFETRHLPLAAKKIPAEQFVLLRYQVKPHERAEFVLEKTQMHWRSPLGLWWKNSFLLNDDTVRVYPNFASALTDSLNGVTSHTSMIDIKPQRKRGDGTDFDQLREYQKGDSLRKIDWKATARMNKLISRQYQEEKDQQVMVMLDCGRRMRAMHNGMSHFDHVLNSVIHLARTVLKQGDSIGLYNFATQEERFLPPLKGATKTHAFLNQLFDLQSSLAQSDYVKATQSLLKKLKKRSLVIILTNLRDEDDTEILAAIKLLQKNKHLVLVANLREQDLDAAVNKTVETFDDALMYGALEHYLQARQQLNIKLKTQGAWVLDVMPDKLTGQMINSYVAIKHSGRL